MRSIIITPGGDVSEGILHNTENIEAAIGCDTFDGRRVCSIPGGGFLYVFFDDVFIAKRLPVNRHVRGLYGGGDLCGNVVLRVCNEAGEAMDVPSSMTVDNWRAEIDRYRAMPQPPRASFEEMLRDFGIEKEHVHLTLMMIKHLRSD